jgi:hypothetical protein
MSTVPFPPRAAGKILDDALAAGVDAIRALDTVMGGDQSMDDEELAAERVIRPFVEQLTANPKMQNRLALALAGWAWSDANQWGEW